MMSFLILAILSIIFTYTDSNCQESVLWGSLEKGRYSVGLKIIEHRDQSRFIDSGKVARPVQALVWYPAVLNTKVKPVLYKNYISLIASEVNFHNDSDSSKKTAITAYSRLLTSNGITDKAAGQLLNTKMAAHQNAQAAAGHFPCVLVAQGNMNPAGSMSVLCEYLASHGYYVASSPSPMRIIGPLTDTTQAYQYAKDQEMDMAFISNELKAFKNADTNEVALIGYSFGGRGAFLMLNDNPKIKAFVSLDGGIANKIGKSWLHGIHIDKRKITSPILHFYQDTETYVVADFDLINSLHNSDRYLIKIDNMRHALFSNMGMAVGVIPGIDFTGAGKDDIRQKCEFIYRATLAFLNTFVKGEKDDYREKLSESKIDFNFVEMKELKKGEQ